MNAELDEERGRERRRQQQRKRFEVTNWTKNRDMIIWMSVLNIFGDEGKWIIVR
jgi:hypothetical protein